jgi:hypothetical protein
MFAQSLKRPRDEDLVLLDAKESKVCPTQPHEHVTARRVASASMLAFASQFPCLPFTTWLTSHQPYPEALPALATRSSGASRVRSRHRPVAARWRTQNNNRRLL